MIQFAPEPSGRAAFDAFWHGLLVANWLDPQGPLRLNPKLALADLASATFFQTTRIFLAGLDESNGAEATASGNHNRIFVRQMFDRVPLPNLRRESTLAVCKVINEQDVWSLHLARIASELAGLVA